MGKAPLHLRKRQAIEQTTNTTDQPQQRKDTNVNRSLINSTTDTSSIRTSLLSQILVSLAVSKLPLTQWTPRFEDARVTQAVDSIEKGYPSKIDNATLARAARMHPSASFGSFGSAQGVPHFAYLMSLRLEEACILLHFDEASLDEIAQKTGFGDATTSPAYSPEARNCSREVQEVVNVSKRLVQGYNRLIASPATECFGDRRIHEITFSKYDLKPRVRKVRSHVNVPSCCDRVYSRFPLPGALGNALGASV